MICPELTQTAARSTFGLDHRLNKDRAGMGAKVGRLEAGRKRPLRVAVAALALGFVLTLGGCITVAAPDKPIVIELNINIEQKVVFRLAADAQNTIEQNGDVF